MTRHSTAPRDTTYRHLGPFGDLVAAVSAGRPLFPAPSPAEARAGARLALRSPIVSEQPQHVREGSQWTIDGVRGGSVSWQVGFGPRTEAWVFAPADAEGRLPAILALHDHGAYKFFGKEKIADGADGPASGMEPYRASYYGGRPFVHALAKAGFLVLVHDVFTWGSRRFPADIMPDGVQQAPSSSADNRAADAVDIDRYNAAAIVHEHVIEKYCTLLGTSFAAIVAYEDRVARNYLAARSDVDPGRLGCIGLSGGGCRAVLLRATCDRPPVTVVAGMMSSYAQLLDQHVATHSWLFFPQGWSQFGDWPDLAACGAPAPLLVQYNLDDELFPLAGMLAAHARLTTSHDLVGQAERYVGQFYPGPHKFDTTMQDNAAAWLVDQLL